jgi:hypothetical protein
MNPIKLALDVPINMTKGVELLHNIVGDSSQPKFNQPFDYGGKVIHDEVSGRFGQ